VVLNCFGHGTHIFPLSLRWDPNIYEFEPS